MLYTVMLSSVWCVHTVVVDDDDDDDKMTQFKYQLHVHVCVYVSVRISVCINVYVPSCGGWRLIATRADNEFSSSSVNCFSACSVNKD